MDLTPPKTLIFQTVCLTASTNFHEKSSNLDERDAKDGDAQKPSSQIYREYTQRTLWCVRLAVALLHLIEMMLKFILTRSEPNNIRLSSNLQSKNDGQNFYEMQAN